MNLKDLLIEEKASVQNYNEAIEEKIFSDKIMNPIAGQEINNFNFKGIEGHNLFGIGKAMKAKQAEESMRKAQELIEQRQLTYTGDITTNGYTKLVYTSPNMVLGGKKCNVISSGSNCRDGYGTIKQYAFLALMLAIYDYGAEHYDTILAKGVELIYTNNKVTIDKNYDWIAKNWAKPKNVYLRSIYTNSGWWVLLEAEADTSKLKGMQDVVAKKSIAHMDLQYHCPSGKLYYYGGIINGQTSLFDIKPVK